MKRLFQQHHVVKSNFLPIVGFCLCFYFTYHIVSGERSYLRLVSLERNIERLEKQQDILTHQRKALENKVAMLRPGSIDPDLLEERARAVLGYHHPDEIVVMRVQ